jgi:multisubunit Na+/H+ antiporter MnhF subunit
VNVWLWADCFVLLLLLPCMAIAVRAPIADAVVALEAAGALGVLALGLAAQGLGETYVWDLAIVVAFLQLVGSLLFVRYLERGL